MITPHTTKKHENPFFQMKACLEMLQNVSKLTDKTSKSVVHGYINNAWKESKDDLAKRQMFFSLLFSLGDITNREHNVFKGRIKDPEAGGAGLRKVFLYVLEWMHSNVPEQFYKFLPLYGEYYNLGASTAFHILWTDRWKGTVTETFKINVNVDRLTDHISSVLRDPKTTHNELALWARWLWHVPSSKRKRKFVVTEKGLNSVHKKYNGDAKVGDVITRVGDKQAATIEKDKFVLGCIDMLSKKMGWEVRTYANNTQYIGYRAFRTKYLMDSEAVMFSTGKITALDKTQLLAWFDQLPGGARYRVQRRIIDKGDMGALVAKTRWITKAGLNVGSVYLEWMRGKEEAQKAIRSLSMEDKAKMVKEDPNALRKMEKAAKINTGGESIVDVLVNMFSQASTNQEANLKAHSLLEAMKVQVPVLICADISGSTSGRPVTYKGVQFTPQAFIKLLTTVFLLKNPDPELSEMFIRFDDKAEVIANGTKGEASTGNRFMANSMQEVGNLIDRGADFVTNFNSVSKWIISRNSTHFNVIADGLKAWVDAGGAFRQERIDMINKYPVFLCLSDGDLNGVGNPPQVVLDFQSKMRQWFGWEGVVVIWDVNMATNQRSHFEGLTNVIHYIGFNPSMVNQIFTNLHDLDIVDVYSALETFSRSNRYAPVRDLVI